MFEKGLSKYVKNITILQKGCYFTLTWSETPLTILHPSLLVQGCWGVYCVLPLSVTPQALDSSQCMFVAPWPLHSFARDGLTPLQVCFQRPFAVLSRPNITFAGFGRDSSLFTQ